MGDEVEASAQCVRDHLQRPDQRSWRLHHRTGHTFADLARRINPIVRGWMQYYGAFYRSALARTSPGRRNTLGRELFGNGLRALTLAVQVDHAHHDVGWYPAWTAELHPGAACSRQSFAGALT